MVFIKRLFERRIWSKIYKQRLTEPLHLNVFSFFIFLFGSFRKKVEYDLILRPYSAFGILQAADKAKEIGLKKITVIEFGVANGAGLMNMIEISKKVTKTTGVEIQIFGFDTAKGMPEPIDFKDHPEYYNTGDYPMNKELLLEKINGEAKIIFGPIKENLDDFKKEISFEAPIGFISIDVDYYSSTKDIFKLLTFEAQYFLPLTYLYFDDISLPHHNSKCGELLAIKEYNEEFDLRNIEYHSFLVNERIFKNADWIKQIYYFHLLDHDYRSNLIRNREVNVLDNPYLKFDGNEKKFN